MKDLLGTLLADWRTRAILPYLRGRALDVGCGTNILIRRYAGEGVGADVHQWGDVDVIIEDSSRLPFDDATFDTICCIAALNHIPNRSQFLAEAHRLLVPDGRFVMTMIPPGISRIWHLLRSPWDADQHERGMKDGEVYGLTAMDVRRLLADAGFRVEVEQPFMCGVNRVYVTGKHQAQRRQRSE